jgi:hypothetical protein
MANNGESGAGMKMAASRVHKRSKTKIMKAKRKRGESGMAINAINESIESVKRRNGGGKWKSKRNSEASKNESEESKSRKSKRNESMAKVIGGNQPKRKRHRSVK